MNDANLKLIERYVAGAAKLRAAIAGLHGAQLDALPIPGTWSIRTIVVHLMHAELFLVARILQTAAEETPTVMNWSENDFVARLHYEAVPIDAALATIDGLRATTAATLRRLDDADFARPATHSLAGRMTMVDFVRKACDHLDHHLEFAAKKRAMLSDFLSPVPGGEG